MVGVFEWISQGITTSWSGAQFGAHMAHHDHGSATFAEMSNTVTNSMYIAARLGWVDRMVGEQQVERLTMTERLQLQAEEQLYQTGKQFGEYKQAATDALGEYKQIGAEKLERVGEDLTNFRQQLQQKFDDAVYNAGQRFDVGAKQEMWHQEGGMKGFLFGKDPNQAPHVPGLTPAESESLYRMNGKSGPAGLETYDAGAHNPIENKLRFDTALTEDLPQRPDSAVLQADGSYAWEEKKLEVPGSFGDDEYSLTRYKQTVQQDGTVTTEQLKYKDQYDAQNKYESYCKEIKHPDGTVVKELRDDRGRLLESRLHDGQGNPTTVTRSFEPKDQKYCYRAEKDLRGPGEAITSFEIKPGRLESGDGRWENRLEVRNVYTKPEAVDPFQHIGQGGVEEPLIQEEDDLFRSFAATEVLHDALEQQPVVNVVNERHFAMPSDAEKAAMKAEQESAARRFKLDNPMALQREVDPDKFKHKMDPSLAILFWAENAVLALILLCGMGEPDTGERLTDSEQSVSDACASLDAAQARSPGWSGSAADEYNTAVQSLMKYAQTVGVDGIFAEKSLMSNVQQTLWWQTKELDYTKMWLGIWLTFLMLCEPICLVIAHTCSRPTSLWAQGIFAGLALERCTEAFCAQQDYASANATQIRTVKSQLDSLLVQVNKLLEGIPGSAPE